MILLSLILGHILGDYFIQTQIMAEMKSKFGAIGTKWCVIHCALYSLAVCALLSPYLSLYTAILGFIGIFISHYPIDRYGLAYKFMKFKGMPNINDPLGAAFAAIIYVVLDNTTHLVLMALWLNYLGIKLV